MAFCTNCGAQVLDDAKFCTACGTATAPATAPVPPAPEAAAAAAPTPEVNTAAPAPEAAAAYAPGQAAQPGQPGQPYGAPQQNYGAAPQPAPNYVATGTMQADPRDVEDNKVMAILAYIIWFIPLIAGTYKTSPYTKYHTNQGIILFLTSLVCGVGLAIIFGIITAILTATGSWSVVFGFAGLTGIIWPIIWLGILALAIYGIVNAAQGQLKPLPVIGKFTILK